MSKLVHFCILSAFAVSGCLHTGGDPKPIKAQAGVDLIHSASQIRDVDKFRFHPTEPNSDQSIIDKCRVSSQEAPGFVAGAAAAILPIVASWIIDYAMSAASAWAKQRLAEYSGITVGAVSFGPPDNKRSFYTSAPPPELAVRCVRLRRMYTPKESSVSMVAAEAIILIELTPARDALQITPLRLYFDVPLARTSSDRDAKLGVSVGATFDALWQLEPTGEGKSVRVWSETVAAQKITDVNNGSRQRFFYYNLATPTEANPPVAVPLVPWSLSLGNKSPRASVGTGKLTLTLAEAGDPPLVLKIIAGTLNDHGKDIGDFLKDAAKKALE